MQSQVYSAGQPQLMALETIAFATSQLSSAYFRTLQHGLTSIRPESHKRNILTGTYAAITMCTNIDGETFIRFVVQ
jgi:hypothetical protein